MGLVHGQIQESNARTRLRLYERVANHVVTPTRGHSVMRGARRFAGHFATFCAHFAHVLRTFCVCHIGGVTHFAHVLRMFRKDIAV